MPLPILQHFQHGHLPPDLAAVSAKFCDLAQWVHDNLPQNSAETTVALRKLLEGKDAAVRAVISARNPDAPAAPVIPEPLTAEAVASQRVTEALAEQQGHPLKKWIVEYQIASLKDEKLVAESFEVEALTREEAITRFFATVPQASVVNARASEAAP